MIRYEELIEQLLGSARRCGLNSYHSRNQVEITTLERKFTFLCVPIDEEPPHLTRAQISFHWDSMLTSESIYGGNCSLYHDETEDCTHDEFPNEAFTELEIEYQFEIDKDFQMKTDVINNELFNLFKRNMLHENIPYINWGAFVSNEGRSGISKVAAGHHWHIELENNDLDFDSIFLEILDNIKEIKELPFIKKNFEGYSGKS